jgi:hypothetical protein
MLILVCLDIELTLTQDRRTVYPKRTMGTEIILGASEVLLGDEAQVDARFGLFGDSAILDARLVQGFRRMYHRLRNHFGCSRWISYVTLVI